jgi:hypothetical protein
VDVRVVDGELVGQTRQHIMMLSELAMLGCVTGGGVILRCSREDETIVGPVKEVYGWILGPEGILGMSEGELFNACCTTREGEAIPPNFGVRYVATDAVRVG